MNRTSLLSAALVAVVFILALPLASVASCAPRIDLTTSFAQAETVFVGRIVDIQSRGTAATVKVLRVWKGPDLPSTVWVNGRSSVEGNTASSVDRLFRLDTYVFFPVNSTPPFLDNACTNTQRYTAAGLSINPFPEESLIDLLAAVDPHTEEMARDSDDGSVEPPPTGPWRGALGWILGGAALTGLAVALRRSSPQRP